jgi:hypothetical protein
MTAQVDHYGMHAAMQMRLRAGAGSALSALAIAARCLYNSPQQVFLPVMALPLNFIP